MSPSKAHLQLVKDEANSDAEPTPIHGEKNDFWAIRVNDLSKKYHIYSHDRNRLYEFFGNRSHHHEHWSIKNLHFQINQGECFGVIGSNGAGKSTLLKMLAGITAPSSGEIQIKGAVSTLLDLGLGFHPSFTGRENIGLNCKLLGMSQKDIEMATPIIIAFAELGDFIDYPIRTYSAGMQLRLGFAIAAHAPADILLIDEVLTVGDQRFQRKCVGKIEEFLLQNRTIVLVSHDLHAIRSLCDRVLWLDKGEIVMVGPAREVVDRYIQGDSSSPISGPFMGATHRPPNTLDIAYSSTIDDPHLKSTLLTQCHIPNPEQYFQPAKITPMDVVDGEQAIIQGTGEVQILKVQILDGAAHPRQQFQSGEDLIVAVSFRTIVPVPRPIFGVALFRENDLYIHGPNTRFDGVLDDTYHGVYTFFIRWKKLPLLSGAFRISIAIFDQHHLKPHIWHNQLYEITISSPIEDHGLVILEHDWGMLTHLKADV